jgi:hypothetical protein
MGCKMHGISDLQAIVIFTGLALVLVAGFVSFINTNYSRQVETLDLSQIVSSERLSTLIRLINTKGSHATFLLKRLDSKNTIAFFMYDGSSYTKCSEFIVNISNGYLDSMKIHDLRDIILVQDSGIYDFPSYARSLGLPSSGNVLICVVKSTGNTLLTINPITPTLGPGDLEINASNGAWVLSGILQFTLTSISVINIGGVIVILPPDTNIRIDVNSTRGLINLNTSYIKDLDVEYSAIYVNGTSFEIGLSKEVTISNTTIRELYSSLTTDINLSSNGFANIRYNNTDALIKGENYIKIYGWAPSVDKWLFINLDNDLMASGYVNCVYVGRVGEATLMFFTITYVNDKPILVDKYVYSFRIT